MERDLSGIISFNSLENNRAGLEIYLSFSLFLVLFQYKTFSLLALMQYSLNYLYN